MVTGHTARRVEVVTGGCVNVDIATDADLPSQTVTVEVAAAAQRDDDPTIAQNVTDGTLLITASTGSQTAHRPMRMAGMVIGGGSVSSVTNAGHNVTIRVRMSADCSYSTR